MIFTRARRLARNYYKLERLLQFYESLLDKETFAVNGYMVNKNYRQLCRTVSYLKLYKAVFSKSLCNLSREEAFIVKEVYIRRKSVCKTALENYLSESSVYRILNKFSNLFFFNISKTKRIINPLTAELADGRIF